jgi:solute carrier family 66 (lysosomal lysine-arginine transporter), member 1
MSVLEFERMWLTWTGLSLLFFILSLLGNVTYGGGIVFHSTEKEYFLTNLPWLIGSFGTMFEDIMIFVQFHIYKEGRRLEAETAVA